MSRNWLREERACSGISCPRGLRRQGRAPCLKPHFGGCVEERDRKWDKEMGGKMKM